MNTTLSPIMDETLRYIYSEVIERYTPEYIKSIEFEYTPWVFSILGSIVIGLSGIFPLLIIPLDAGGSQFNDPAESKSLKVLLSFAVGGLLGDVFLHLLPEAWSSDLSQKTAGKYSQLQYKEKFKRFLFCFCLLWFRTIDGHPSMRSGLWVLGGVLIFTIVEKIFSGYVNADESNPQPKCVEIANCLLRKSGGKIPDNKDGLVCAQNGSCDIEDVPNGCFLAGKSHEKKENQPNKIAGYLNLLANSIDNFTHGLAVAGSFLVSFRHGLLGTFAILLHEIPHEVGDFAILLRSGFSRWDAAKAQLLTAGAGLVGALVAIGGTNVTSAMEARTSWIMPFTAGGFLHISLVTVLPDLLKETDSRESIKQLFALCAGIGVMAFMTIVFES
ncbi:zinc transporter ZIP13 homolog isoform X1 [Contarinia nasturtii]|uniref:zinc transporter ZIP13 homolog isoform X1 n=1 Tax=Contarinia nasturtii TaxID=265458 RepID=UPI0012D42A1E|nr:zinc transporter ZIP13 homolog isoform X1 [Contarinia nasturtii]XP_031618581.1 zinc transporter ZIP13 homolog isoform X1 [Contarinia nasturtii]XP_031618582.1 zinc transporter ZIP13 homolog isoform X1 [Contarinia nasturtii]XP_031618583.1 zinc transporter ZIP13 homolog isoform X1 [Contarinia nasturtii]